MVIHDGIRDYWVSYLRRQPHAVFAVLDAARDPSVLKLVHEMRAYESLFDGEELADVARLSPRQFSRAFSAETGQSPAKAVEHLRVEAARLMLEQGRHSMDVIAYEVGFSDRDRMRRAFLRTLGQPPQAIRRFGRQSRLPAEEGDAGRTQPAAAARADEGSSRPGTV